MIFLESGVAFLFDQLTLNHQTIIRNHLEPERLKQSITQGRLFLFSHNRIGGQSYLGTVPSSS